MLNFKFYSLEFIDIRTLRNELLQMQSLQRKCLTFVRESTTHGPTSVKINIFFFLQLLQLRQTYIRGKLWSWPHNYTNLWTVQNWSTDSNHRRRSCLTLKVNDRHAEQQKKVFHHLEGNKFLNENVSKY